MIPGAHRLFTLGFVLAMVGLPVPAQTLTDLARRAEAKGLRTGIVVRDLRSGRNLYRHRSRESFIPASNQKLVTFAAALWGLGSEFEFRTVFRVRGGVLEVVAGGDPNWLHATPHDPAVIFAQVAARLRAAGIGQLRGIRLLRGEFTGPNRPRGWPKSQFAATYCAPTGGLVLEAGCFRAVIAPGRIRARVTMLAPPIDAVFRGAIKMSSKRKSAHWLSHSGETFTAHGRMSKRADATKVRGVCHRPEWLFGAALRSVLAAKGVAIESSAPARDLDVLTYKTSLRRAFVETLTVSSNFHAEQILRVIGAEKRGAGTFDAGCAAVREIMAARLALPAAMVIVDGSGLSRGNRTTPIYLVSIIEQLCKGAHAELFVNSLAQGGISGTLRRRFAGKGQAVVGRATRAKTGYISGVRSLSGMVQIPGGGVRLFSILMNSSKGSSTVGSKGLQDAMVTAIYHGRLK